MPIRCSLNCQQAGRVLRRITLPPRLLGEGSLAGLFTGVVPLVIHSGPRAGWSRPAAEPRPAPAAGREPRGRGRPWPGRSLTFGVPEVFCPHAPGPGGVPFPATRHWHEGEGEVMPRIAEQAGPVTGGVDTHADVHVAAVVDQVGRVLGTQAFPATAAGYPGRGGRDELARRAGQGRGGGHRPLR